jgi:hypothetical protein
MFRDVNGSGEISMHYLKIRRSKVNLIPPEEHMFIS